MRYPVLISLASLLVAAPLSAQQADNDPMTALRRSFNEVATWTTRAAELVPAERYDYRPVESVRTFAQLIGHLADSYNYYCAQAAGRQVEWADPVEKGVSAKAALLERLAQARAACTAPYASGTNIRALMDNVTHTNLHYGNIVTYLRMMGLTPPSS